MGRPTTASTEPDPLDTPAKWRAFYDRYMQSPEWQERRRKVLLRSKGVCEACGNRMATQCHHLTYKRLGHEPLFDLAAVCGRCHEELHELP